mgnify:CR=1 FL=1
MVLIVPLWNWNLHQNAANHCRFCVLIVPLWNWNKFRVEIFVSVASSNCTFMELKYEHCCQCYHYQNVLIVPLWNWNRLLPTTLSRERPVLIVPLWNWNMSLTIAVIWPINRSNCTFMELKSQRKAAGASNNTVLIVPLWNWNDGSRCKSLRTRSSNCTFMELKWI